MQRVIINNELCKGCGLCVEACPTKILSISKTTMNNAGYYVAYCKDQSKCISCAFCATMCPDCVITVQKD